VGEYPVSCSAPLFQYIILRSASTKYTPSYRLSSTCSWKKRTDSREEDNSKGCGRIGDGGSVKSGSGNVAGSSTLQRSDLLENRTQGGHRGHYTATAPEEILRLRHDRRKCNESYIVLGYLALGAVWSVVAARRWRVMARTDRAGSLARYLRRNGTASLVIR